MISGLLHPKRLASVDEDTPEGVDAYIDSRALAHPTQLEDEFVQRALNLGVESGMILDVGTRVGLISLKMLWQSEDFFAIGLDQSTLMIDRARETANAWELGERAFFQVGDARRMRFKSAYFDIVVSDCILHRFDDASAVLREIQRVAKPKGAIFIRDFRRPNRFQMAQRIQIETERFGKRMQQHLENALRSAYTVQELGKIVAASGLQDARVLEIGQGYIGIERPGQTDPNSWVKVREQYR
jgi:ubiquinone/menaquinone biosynthesis C-methylase UbiE